MQPLVMGILNVTPDSFYDGGRHDDPGSAVAWGCRLAEEGADIVDVGGESSRPGAEPVPLGLELSRVLPVVEALAPVVRVSIDTAKPEVARAAVAAGATLVNDVSGRCAEVAAAAGVGLVVMHMRGTPKTMRDRATYRDVVAEVRSFLAEGAARARELGVREVYVDPGIGFAKTAEHDLALLHALPELVADGAPVLVGASRKSFLGRVSAREGEAAPGPGDRLEASLAVATWALAAGAAVVRVHDVAATVQAARLAGSEPLTAVPLAAVP